MTPFQIISIIVSGISLLCAIFGVYLKLQIDITKINMQLKSYDKDLQAKEIAILNIERLNREDHKEIMQKIDELIKK